MTAYVLARRFRAQPIYEALLEQDGIKLGAASGDRLDALRVGPLLKRVHRAPLTPKMAADEVRLRCNVEHDRHVYPVVDEERRVIGIITPEDLSLLGNARELAPIVTASDLMRAPLAVRTSDEVGLALERMLANGVRELPVVDETDRLVGIIDDRAVATALQSSAQHPNGDDQARDGGPDSAQTRAEARRVGGR